MRLGFVQPSAGERKVAETRLGDERNPDSVRSAGFRRGERFREQRLRVVESADER